MRVSSFRKRQFLTLLVLGAASAIVFLMIFLRLSRTYVTQRMTTQMKTVAELKINQVHQWIDQGRQVAQLVSTNHVIMEHFAQQPIPQPEGVGTSEEDRLLTQIRGIKQVFPYVTSISLLSVDEGKVLFSSDPALIGRVRQNEAYFQAGQDDIYVSQVMYSVASEAPILIISAPTRGAEGELLAVVAIEMALQDLDEAIVHHIGLGQTGVVYLVDAYGFYVTLPPGIHGGVLSTIARSEGVKRALSGLNGSGTYADPQGVDVLGVYNWLPEPGLGLLVEMEEAELYQQIRQVWTVIVTLAFSVLLLALGASYGLVNWLVTPLEKIARAARAIQTGDLSVRTEPGGPDEIGQLSAAFNEMANSVQLSHDELEQLVEKRTVELGASEARYRAVIEAQTDVIYRFLYDGTITFANKAFCLYFGVPFDKVIGTNLLDYVPPEVHTRVREQIAGLSAETPITTNENENVDRHGEPHWFHWTDQAILDHQGRITEYQALGRDITDRKQAEEALQAYSERLAEMVEERTQELRGARERLRRQDRLAVLGQLAGGVGHELRNPLGVISNAIYYLRATQSGVNHELWEYLDLISNEVQSAEKIIADLLDLARIRSSSRRSTQVSALIAASLEKAIPEGIAVEVRIPEDLASIWVDPFQITQVMGNLIANACQAMPKGGKLTVVARGNQDRIAISIADTGTGISPENMERIFEPLFTTKARGIGLGLAISERLIEANGGRIEVESVEGVGSTFTMHLPMQEGPHDQEEPS